MAELLDATGPADSPGDNLPDAKQGNAIYETKRHRLEREIRDISNYLEALKHQLRELPDEDIAGPAVGS
ncbi:hypothetical protein HYW35_04370 [Candidatus Saccharibacteria bacterium]|nr:hypothetical protein [Candidatus Saccharibacteria bacterium]